MTTTNKGTTNLNSQLANSTSASSVKEVNVDKVAGGKLQCVKTADNKYIIVPKTYDTEEEAKQAIEKLEKSTPHFPGMGHHQKPFEPHKQLNPEKLIQPRDVNPEKM